MNKGSAKTTFSTKTTLRNDVIAALIAQYSPADEEAITGFVKSLWRTWPLDDISERSAADHGHCFYGLWLSLLQTKAAGAGVIRLKTPQIEEERWTCHRTVLHAVWPDSPFLVDTLRMTLNRLGVPLHLLNSTVLADDAAADAQPKAYAVMYAELGVLADDEVASLRDALAQAFDELVLVVADYSLFITQNQQLQTQVMAAGTPEAEEACQLLKWLEASHFTYLGYREFDAVGKNNALKENTQARLGLCRLAAEGEDSLLPSTCHGEVCNDVLIFTKAPMLSKVQRAVYPDYLVVKRFDEQGKWLGEGHLIGFFTYAVGNTSPTTIPWVRQKLKQVVKASGIPLKTYSYRALQRAIEGFPRDELFQASIGELKDSLLGVANLNERKQVRLFLRGNPYGRFVTALIYVPRDVYSTDVRLKVERILGEALGNEGVESTTFFSESVLARAYLVFKMPAGSSAEQLQTLDISELQAKVTLVATGWQERLEHALCETQGEQKGLPLFRRYSPLFSPAYQDTYDARAAVGDIALFEAATAQQDIAMNVFRPQGDSSDTLRFKVANYGSVLALSDVIPLLENLGGRVLGENPFCLKRQDPATSVWLHDFSLQLLYPNSLMDEHQKAHFSEAFYAVWHQKIDNDAFNRLVVAAAMPWRDIVILRAYAHYFKQTLFSIEPEAIAHALLRHAPLAKMLVEWFYARFQLEQTGANERCQALFEALEAKLNDVTSIDDDRIFRRYIDALKATLRTNFFQFEGARACPDTFVIKMAPQRMEAVPQPKPEFEIFVYSTRMEGVHLRTSKVARGGLRWSDRLSDYRTEVLGLVKAQAVKNAVIVPSGAKGGFVPKRLQKCEGRAEIQAEGIACYQQFIRGLLCVTDNLVNGQTLHPEQVVCLDGDDPYLVVAADKGTATFSDIANAISLEYGHWLGDGFASGGSQGYDHKAMGITAKGGWISVQRHFRERNIDVQKQSISVVGIGDMAGDVFGNGLLLSEQVQLVAAFNHLHIFIDPNPDAAASFKERERLFTTPGTTWDSYDKSLISQGGAVFLRSAKSIPLNKEIKARFGIEANSLTPTEFIHQLLKAPVDLIWNGGIGTYVKASTESHAQVGDKANDNLRVNGGDLRCKVFGEGGNLGMTQLGRIEFCQTGGACNTDFIDNAGGVDCSDHEVNLKILLQAVLARGDLTEKQRNQCLKDYTNEISTLVLNHNIAQTECLSIAERQAVKRGGEYRKLITYLEKNAGLNRKLEFLPNDAAIAERYAKGSSLTRPELAVLLSYAKVMLKGVLTKTALVEDKAARDLAFLAFPKAAGERFTQDVLGHQLLNEIVSTQLANDFINQLGITAAYRFLSSSSIPVEQVMKAFIVARAVFDLPAFNSYITTLYNQVPEETLYGLKTMMARRVRRGVRWFLRNVGDLNAGDKNLSTEQHIQKIKNTLVQVAKTTEDSLAGSLREARDKRFSDYQAQGIRDDWASLLAMPDNLFAGLGASALSLNTQQSPHLCTQVFYGLHNHLQLGVFAGAVSEMAVQSPWQAMARETLLEDIEIQLRRLSAAVVGVLFNDKELDKKHINQKEIDDALIKLLEANGLAAWLNWLQDTLADKESDDISLYHVTLRQLAALVDGVVLG
ncbi:MAG: NAD-glutamate dehydrogenase [Marinagarivorans sp.]|nr:NAD-glutamate dehydrogenase [Marinagarivorans sp.]